MRKTLLVVSLLVAGVPSTARALDLSMPRFDTWIVQESVSFADDGSVHFDLANGRGDKVGGVTLTWPEGEIMHWTYVLEDAETGQTGTLDGDVLWYRTSDNTNGAIYWVAEVDSASGLLDGWVGGRIEMHEVWDNHSFGTPAGGWHCHCLFTAPWLL